MNKSPKQKFQFEREFHLHGSLASMHGSLCHIIGTAPLTNAERKTLTDCAKNLEVTLGCFESETEVLRGEL